MNEEKINNLEITDTYGIFDIKRVKSYLEVFDRTVEILKQYKKNLMIGDNHLTNYNKKLNNKAEQLSIINDKCEKKKEEIETLKQDGKDVTDLEEELDNLYAEKKEVLAKQKQVKEKIKEMEETRENIIEKYNENVKIYKENKGNLQDIYDYCYDSIENAVFKRDLVNEDDTINKGKLKKVIKNYVKIMDIIQQSDKKQYLKLRDKDALLESIEKKEMTKEEKEELKKEKKAAKEKEKEYLEKRKKTINQLRKENELKYTSNNFGAKLSEVAADGPIFKDGSIYREFKGRQIEDKKLEDLNNDKGNKIIGIRQITDELLIAISKKRGNSQLQVRTR